MKTQALARKLGAECFETEDPPVEYQQGESTLRLGGVAIDLDFPVSSAIWSRSESLLAVIEQTVRKLPRRLHILQRDGTKVQEVPCFPDYDFYYLTGSYLPYQGSLRLA